MDDDHKAKNGPSFSATNKSLAHISRTHSSLLINTRGFPPFGREGDFLTHNQIGLSYSSLHADAGVHLRLSRSFDAIVPFGKQVF